MRSSARSSADRTARKAKPTNSAVDLDARARIIQAAKQLFQSSGFRRTSMDAIAEAARTSKRTLYAHFADKHAVLESVLIEFTTIRLAAMAQLSAGSASSRGRLITLARELRESALEDYSLGMYRVLIAEADHLPSLAKRTHRKGPEQLVQVLRQPLEGLGIKDVALVARLFYDLLVLAPVQRRLVGAADDMIDAEQIVDVILHGVKPRKSQRDVEYPDGKSE